MGHVQHPYFDENGIFCGTKASKASCTTMKRKLKGKCLLAFSRGKDSIAAWIYLLELGFEVIPYHLASYPHLSYVDQSLDYYEDWFDTKIYRFFLGEQLDNIRQLIYQPFEDIEFLNALDFWYYTNPEAGIILGRHLEIPDNKIWMAQGHSMYDNFFRIPHISRTKGIFERDQVFYPIWDWKPTQIREFVSGYDISLPPDYLLDKTSTTSVPLLGVLLNMKELYPEDYERVLLWFPFAEALVARNHFRTMHEEERERKLRKKGKKLKPKKSNAT